jgi:hypothetical protein
LYDRNGIRLTNINRINLYSAGITTQYGEMSFSPLGDKVAMALHGSFAVYEFDRCEGRIGSEIMHIDTIHRVYGCAFSPNGKFVYISTTSGFGPGSNIIYQVSLSPDQFSNFPVSEIYKQQAGGVYGNGQLEIGPDGKIYSTMGCRFYGCGTSVKNTTLSVINYPDLEGLACDFDTFTISLSDKKTWFALPNMVNYALGALEGSDCDTLGGSTAVPETATLPQWEITPTVSTGWYSFNGPEQVLLLVYDVWGRTVWQGSATGRRIDLSDLPSGLYLVQAKWEQRQETFRILKQ